MWRHWSDICENEGTINKIGGTIYKNRGTIYKNEGTINKIGGAIYKNRGTIYENEGTIYESNDSWILTVMAPDTCIVHG